MPSIRGAGLLASGVALLIAGRAFGLRELTYLGVGALVAVLLAVLAVSLGRARVVVSRRIAPPRTQAGEQVQVRIEVHNRSALPTSVLELTDHIEGLPRPATFTSRVIPPGRRAAASYALTCRARGVYDIGPLFVAVSDPFGLARLSRQVDLVTKLAVYPTIVALSPLSPASGHDSATQAERPALHTPQGEEFYTLREYQMGDDLRKVHWRSTARRARLMIKQEEIPWHARGTVVLDVREAALGQSGGAPFESAVVAAASAVQHFGRQGEFCRFVSTDGAELAFGFGLDHFRSILDRLAVVEETRADRFAGAVAGLTRADQTGGALVFCGGLLSEDEARRLAGLRGRYSPVVAVRYPPSTSGGDLGRARETEREAKVDALLGAARVLVVHPGPEGLAAAWAQAAGLARASRRSGRWLGSSVAAGKGRR